jgi:hypothetical protein
MPTSGRLQTPRGMRLLARDLIIAQDGTHYAPGKHGYRILTGHLEGVWQLQASSLKLSTLWREACVLPINLCSAPADVKGN